MDDPDTWLPRGWAHPRRVDLPTGQHLRPIEADRDVDADMAAVMGSRERLWSIYGRAWGWPPAGMTREADLADLRRHEREVAAHESFLYVLVEDGSPAILGCVYVDPPEKAGDADAEVSWWVVDELVGTPVEAALDELVPRWLAEAWPLRAPRLVGRDLSWDDWLALPDRT